MIKKINPNLSQRKGDGDVPVKNKTHTNHTPRGGKEGKEATDGYEN